MGAGPRRHGHRMVSARAARRPSMATAWWSIGITRASPSSWRWTSKPARNCGARLAMRRPRAARRSSSSTAARSRSSPRAPARSAATTWRIGKLLWEGPGLTNSCVPSPVHGDGVVYVMSGFRRQRAPCDSAGGSEGRHHRGAQAIVWKSRPRHALGPFAAALRRRALFPQEQHRHPERLQRQDRREALRPAAPRGRAQRVRIARGRRRTHIHAGREGAVAVVARGPEFKLLALNQLDDGFDASPVVVGNEIYLRGRKHLYRISKE